MFPQPKVKMQKANLPREPANLRTLVVIPKLVPQRAKVARVALLLLENQYQLNKIKKANKMIRKKNNVKRKIILNLRVLLQPISTIQQRLFQNLKLISNIKISMKRKR